MNVLLVSECRKNALKETRRILDQFAERRGERTWQTAITMDGLLTLRKLLRKTARKNTAVACHWIRGKDHSELMWIVGNAGQFNSEGSVPTNSTSRDVLRSADENNWHTGEVIKLLAQLGGLLHDLGKASAAFQSRLRSALQGRQMERNLYRHEWVSLRLFQAFVGNDDDLAWLERLADENTDHSEQWVQEGHYLRDGMDVAGEERYPFAKLLDQAPLAAALGWLIVTHHRLPLKPARNEENKHNWFGKKASEVYPHRLPALSEIAHDWNELATQAKPEQIAPYWETKDLPVASLAWRKQAARVARRLLEISQKGNQNWLDNPYVMHLARLCLMLADHHYSSLGVDARGMPVSDRLVVRQSDGEPVANTTRNQYRKTVFNQSLLEHLLGVGRDAGAIAHALPGFERYLPRLANHRGLRKRSGNPRFAWQDKAFDAAVGIREQAREQGAFIINMASTGCGKTLANARIMYALADPQLGVRVTYALGLRTLTLQTGGSYRNDLHLDDDELAILVGGSASRTLFEYYEAQAEQTGSASVQELLEEDSHVLYEGNTADHPLLSKALANPNISRLLSAPMLVCTVDHMVPATEAQRAGRQIAPMLRLLSSDLILDELDDYDLNDLPALTRLVYWAGLLGSRVLLSSATLPPALVEGMFMAYHKGRSQYLQNRGAAGGLSTGVVEVPCVWVDEFGTRTAMVASDSSIATEHADFVAARVTRLSKDQPLRKAEILPVAIQGRQREQVYCDYTRSIWEGCWRLHQAHVETDPHSGKKVSFGIVRMANIEPLVQIAQRLYTQSMPADIHLHLCVYHSRFPLVQRSAIENLLDQAFNRKDLEGKAVFNLPAVRKALDTSGAQQHMFVVLASPVCEVGRDWDADWAVAEPSSMRSLIQLAGRVQRHRRKLPAEPNMLLLDAPIRHFLRAQANAPVYIKPGFERDTGLKPFLLATHRLTELLQPEEYQAPSATPRIAPRPAADRNHKTSLVDLEQERMAASMYPRPPFVVSARGRGGSQEQLQQDEAAPGWQYPHALLTGVLQQQQPFRDSASTPTTTLVFLPNEEEETLELYRVEDQGRRGEKLYVPVNESMRHHLALQPAERVSCWGDFDLLTLLQEQAEAMDMELCRCAESMAVVEVLSNDAGWYWHEWLGFFKK